MADRFDLVVVGAGPGGYTAAIRAAQLGMRVACVDKRAALGGTCLNVGCIPSKALLDSSELYHQARHGLAAHGIGSGEVTLDLAAMMARKDRVVRGLTQGVGGLLKKNEVTAMTGTARFVDPRRLEVAGDDGTRIVEAERILIATGSEPTPLRSLPFDGAHVISSTEALSLPTVPERLLVVGAGAVGLELGSVWRRLGAEVTMVEFLDRIVPAMDGEAAGLLQKALQKLGLTFRLGTSATGATVQGERVTVTLEHGGETSTEETSVVLVAVGRRPNVDGLGTDTIGVALDRQGRVTVDERFETNVGGVFAIGDVIPGPMLAHKAEEEGIAAVEMMAGHAGHVNYQAVPNVVYTWPELASVGLTSEEAEAQGLATAVGRFPFRANARARCMNESDGLVKILADAKTDRILGVHIVGPRASDLIAEAAVAIEFGGSAEDLARSCHAHPTLPEAIREAALAVDRRAINI